MSDDPTATPCGRCARCTGRPLTVELDRALVVEAQEFLRRGSEGRHEIVTLTDDELAAVDGEAGVAPRYWYQAQSPADRELARVHVRIMA